MLLKEAELRMRMTPLRVGLLAHTVCLPLCEQGRKPWLIKGADAVGSALMQLLPEQTGFLLLVPRGKRVFVKIHFDQLAQIEFCGIVTAAFPVANGLLREPYPQRNFFLGQTGSPTQGHQLLCKVKVARFVAMMITHVSPLHQAYSARAEIRRAYGGER